MANEHIAFLEEALKYMQGDTDRLDLFLSDNPEKKPSPTSALGSQGKAEFEYRYYSIEDFKLTIPIGISLFSLAELFGYMIRESAKPKETGGSIKNFEKFFTLGRIEEVEIKILWNVFRNGMAHNFFSKLNTSIDYNTQEEKLFYKDKDEKLTLNVHKLKVITLHIADYIINKKYPGVTILLANYENIRSFYEDKHQTDISSLLKKIEDGTSI